MQKNNVLTGDENIGDKPISEEPVVDLHDYNEAPASNHNEKVSVVDHTKEAPVVDHNETPISSTLIHHMQMHLFLLHPLQMHYSMIHSLLMKM